jgi:hypothetical protein
VKGSGPTLSPNFCWVLPKTSPAPCGQLAPRHGAEFKAKGGLFAEFNGPYTLGAKDGLAEIALGDGTASVSLVVK